MLTPAPVGNRTSSTPPFGTEGMVHERPSGLASRTPAAAPTGSPISRASEAVHQVGRMSCSWLGSRRWHPAEVATGLGCRLDDRPPSRVGAHDAGAGWHN